jgi:hypothetical protein
MKLAQRAYLGCDLIPCANCIRLNISSWFGKVRAARMSRAPAPARRDVTMHSHADPEGCHLYIYIYNGKCCIEDADTRAY